MKLIFYNLEFFITTAIKASKLDHICYFKQCRKGYECEWRERYLENSKLVKWIGKKVSEMRKKISEVLHMQLRTMFTYHESLEKYRGVALERAYKCFFVEHPVGSVLGRAEYQNYLSIMQGVT